MASLRTRYRNDGTPYYGVLYRLDGRQASYSFEDFLSASRFCDLVNRFGARNALATLVDAAPDSQTVEEWVTHYIDHLTGVQPDTVARYRAYLRNDIAPHMGAIPLTALKSDHVAKWINTMNRPTDRRTASAKTIANKHGFLAGALNAAIPQHIASNPCDRIRLPRGQAREPLFLTPQQFDRLLNAVTEPWRLLVEFLVASGCRWGEATALRPSDIDRQAGTVNIVRAWKSGAGGYRLGPPKTAKSKRTIDVSLSVLDKLDYSQEYVFTNRTGGPVRSHGFHRRVWLPAVERAWPSVNDQGQSVTDPAGEILRPRIHDLRHTNASWMIQRGIGLAVVQEHLGHESIQTTIDIYGHLDRQSKKGAAIAIDAALREGRGEGD